MTRLWGSFSVVCICGLFTVRSLESNDIYSIPTKTMDANDILEEHGRFMVSMMNPTVDPCENFYEYACGNWQNDSMVPVLGHNETFLDTIGLKVEELILGYLKNKTSNSTYENSAERKMKEFFDTCLYMSKDLSQVYQTFYNSIKEPVPKNGETLDWMILNFYTGFVPTPLVPLSVQYNSSSYVFEIHIDKPDAYFHSSSFNFTKISEDFKFENKEAMEEELEELVNFEKKLAATTVTLMTNESKWETLEDFLKLHNSSGLNLERFFDLAFNGTADPNWKINYQIMNFTELNNFLQNSDTTVLFKYIRWRMILKFYKDLILDDEETNEEKCQTLTLYFFRNVLIPWFIETAFDNERRADALQVSGYLKDTFYTLIDKTSWLDNKTKSGAKSKLRAMDIVFGYTDDMKDRLKIDEEFKNVSIIEDFWVNLLSLNEKIGRDSLNRAGKSVIDRGIDTNVVNAIYNPQTNQVFMTISISQLPAYHIKLPHSLKFGGIGSVIAHEMAHGFDTECYKYDYDGKKRDWWSAQSLRNFIERYQCLESQYNKFIYKGKRTSGKKTSGDNIADNVGLHIAYQTYLRFLEENPHLEGAQDKPLPDVDLTNKHLFFLKFAQMWCDGRSAVHRFNQLKNDEHALNEFRVIGTLMNMPQFSEEFNCALGTNMNPLKKCIIYGNE